MISRAQHRQRQRLVLWMLTVFFHPGAACALRSTTRKIDRSLAIVVETAQILNRAIFPLKSRAKNFDGSMVGFRPSSETNCADKSAHYHASKQSSGNERPKANNLAASHAFSNMLVKVNEALSILRDISKSPPLSRVPAEYLPYFSMRHSQEFDLLSETDGNRVFAGRHATRPRIDIDFHGRTGNTVIFGGTTARFGAKVEIFADRCSVVLGDDLIGHAGLQLYAPSSVFVGSGTKLLNTRLTTHQGASVAIGDDCQFASDVSLLAAEQHAIFDTRTFELLSLCDEGILIYPHVWIGLRAIVLKRSVIEAGAIIGAMSIVNGAIPKFSLAAGQPAKVIRNDVCWDDLVATVTPRTRAFVAKFSGGA